MESSSKLGAEGLRGTAGELPSTGSASTRALTSYVIVGDQTPLAFAVDIGSSPQSTAGCSLLAAGRPDDGGSINSCLHYYISLSQHSVPASLIARCRCREAEA